MKKAKKWSKRLTALVSARDKVSGKDKATIQKNINAEYKRLGMDSKGKLIKKKSDSKTKLSAAKAGYNKSMLDGVGEAVSGKSLKEGSKAREALKKKLTKKGVDIKGAEKAREKRLRKKAPKFMKSMDKLKKGTKTPIKKKKK